MHCAKSLEGYREKQDTILLSPLILLKTESYLFGVSYFIPLVSIIINNPPFTVKSIVLDEKSDGHPIHMQDLHSNFS